MRKPSTIFKALAGLSLVAVAAFFPATVRAQDDPAIISAVAFNKAGVWKIVITFNKRFTDTNRPEVKDTAHYSLFHLESKAVVGVAATDITSLSNGKLVYTMATMSVDPLTPGDFYQLYVTGLKFGDEAQGTPLSAKVEFTTIPSTSSDSDAGTSLPLTAAEDREDANIYLSGELSRASGTDAVYTADMKVSYEIPAHFWNRAHFFEPLFDLKASSDPEADPDTMKLGVDWDFEWVRRSGSKKFFKPMRLQNSFLVEAERDFDNANLTWGSKLVFPSRLLRNESKRLSFRMRPFVGVELGKNIKSPVEEAENKGIARGLFGSSLNLKYKIKQKALDNVSFEASYTRRLLMLREVYFTKSDEDDEKLRPVFFGRNPRDWIESKLNFNFREDFGAFIGYEYGQQPPSYKLVDHRMKIGLTYKVKFKTEDEP
ncbi:MAG TPA: hypothetical protein VGP08_26050 [Pyrinomonadaceae bacterium]|jgi:hypothetical protein|nr:hypothetical protein [Pyrinomonadaceae bacterium]